MTFETAFWHPQMLLTLRSASETASEGLSRHLTHSAFIMTLLSFAPRLLRFNTRTKSSGSPSGYDSMPMTVHDANLHCTYALIQILIGQSMEGPKCLASHLKGWILWHCRLVHKNESKIFKAIIEHVALLVFVVIQWCIWHRHRQQSAHGASQSSRNLEHSLILSSKQNCRFCLFLSASSKQQCFLQLRVQKWLL